jgi:ABC-type uncharacterized transport system involved in gliding motility auxiliary subunit
MQKQPHIATETLSRKLTLDIFEMAEKRVTKMTEKARAALQTPSKKRKNNTSSINGPSEPKKAKPNPLSRNSKDRATEPLSPSPPTDVIPKPRAMQSRRAIVQTEEEEAAMYEDAIEISNQSGSDGNEPLDKEESAEDELSELY